MHGSNQVHPFSAIRTSVYIYVRRIKRRGPAIGINPHNFRGCRYKTHILCLAFLFLVAEIRASTVVLYRSKTWIIVGADGLYGHPGKQSGTICKLHQEPTFFWAVIGAYNESGRFDVPKLISKAAKHGLTLSEKMDALDRIILIPMRDYLVDLKATDPVFYQRIIEREKMTTVIMFGIENGVATYAADSFRVSTKPRIHIIRSERNSCPGVKCPDGGSLWMDGERDAINAYMRQRGNVFNEPAEMTVRRFVALEISDKPDSVGPPISILFVDSKKSTWLEQGACPAIR